MSACYVVTLACTAPVTARPVPGVRCDYRAGRGRCSRYVSPASFAGLAAGALLAARDSAGPDPVLPAAAVVTVVCARRWNPSVAVIAGLLAIWTAHLVGVS